MERRRGGGVAVEVGGHDETQVNESDCRAVVWYCGIAVGK